MASTFPAVRGRIGGEDFYAAVLTFGEVARLVQFVEEVDDWTSATEPESKSQRKLNHGRVEREMVPYLLTVPDHFYSALTVEIRRLPSEDDAVPTFQPETTMPGDIEIGRLVLDGSEVLCALDGQHRLRSIQIALRENSELAREHVAVIFVPFRSQRRSQSVFSDLNRYARAPSKSINLLFSHRDPMVAVAKGVSQNVPLLHGRVEFESTSLAKHTPCFATFSTLFEMTRAFAGPRELAMADTQAEIDRQSRVWLDLTDIVEPWMEVATGKEHPAYLRPRSLVMHGVGQQALALAVSAAGGAERNITRLARIDWSLKNHAWQGIAVQGARVNNTSTSIRHLGWLIAHMIGVRISSPAATELCRAIAGRGDTPPAALTTLAQARH